MQKKTNITVTGAGDTIKLTGHERLTFAAKGNGGTDYSLDVEVKLEENGTWFTAQAQLVDGFPYATVSGVRAVRYNVSSLGAASSVDFQITGQDL